MIPHPLILSSGSHDPGSGKGCVMNVISYINGDATITDFPSCTNPAVAVVCQHVNDHIAREIGELVRTLKPYTIIPAPFSTRLIDICSLAMGTTQIPTDVLEEWGVEHLTIEEWGGGTRIVPLVDKVLGRVLYSPEVQVHPPGPQRCHLQLDSLHRELQSLRRMAGLDDPAKITEAQLELARTGMGQ